MIKSTRPATQQDIPAIKAILNTIELFPPEYLEEMMADYLNNPDSADIWFANTLDGETIGFGFCAPEKFAEGTFNLYAIGVRKDCQNKGSGGEMMQYLENFLSENGHRILIVETSSSEDLALTRKFYEKLGYHQEAVIREFWTAGEDKVIFWKKL